MGTRWSQTSRTRSNRRSVVAVLSRIHDNRKMDAGVHRHLFNLLMPAVWAGDGRFEYHIACLIMP